MRNFLGILLLSLCVCFNCFGQRKVHLVSTDLPNHTYTEKTDQITNIEMEVHGDSSVMKSLASMTTPMKKSTMKHTEIETQTGRLYHDSLFPEKTTITNMIVNGQSPFTGGFIFYDTRSTSGTVTIDSLKADSVPDKVKDMIMPLVKTLLKQIGMPEHTVKVGESFSEKTPLSFPIPGTGTNLDFSINTTYKLKSISGDMAYFEMQITYSFNSESVSLPMKATGSGSGTMTYDIANSHRTNYELSSSLVLDMSTEGVSIKIKSETTIIEKVKITAN